jgi:hypothetical protein
MSLWLVERASRVAPRFSVGLYAAAAFAASLLRPVVFAWLHVYHVAASGLLVHNDCSFFDGTPYTEKVLEQMSRGSGELHSFPELVRNFESNGVVRSIVGGDWISCQMLQIRGSYTTAEGETLEGFFEFMKQANGAINHRCFNPFGR